MWATESKGNPVSLYEIELTTLDGAPTTLADLRGKAVLIVNVASKCGLTPQYTGLERLQERYADRGFSVIGIPSNQFGNQEPGTAEEIRTFCSTTYGVTFPMMSKINVNDPDRHPLYQELVQTADAEGAAGDVQWNFEKFLIDPEGKVVSRFRPMTEPEDEAVLTALEAVLPN
jgi:glutathione peroxidase